MAPTQKDAEDGGGKAEKRNLEDEPDAGKAKKSKEDTEEGNKADFSVSPDGFTQVYIDGKCLFLGKNGQRAGLGV